jgi:alanyl-tRNA synthetase
MTTSANEIRTSFLRYFERQGHRIVPSSPLVPHDDPTLLFTNAGMNQFKDVFLGRETRDYTRAATAQKCMRVSGKHNDLDNVGPSLRHHTFFEMLGNFSFGDYFKRDAIPMAWELLTGEWKIPPGRLYPTIFKGEAGIPRDDEAHDIWRTCLPADRIGELGTADNFWQMGETGPCGRCSEIYYYRGADVSCGVEAAGGRCRGLDCNCDRYVEIWNNVFMEFDRQPDGTLRPLPAPSIDTGMGLDRVTAVLQGTISNYDNDLFTPLLVSIAGLARLQGLPVEPAELTRVLANHMTPAAVSTRVIADHMRAMTFLIADGVVPSNEKRGYVLRKIMRRAMRHGKRLGMTEPFLHRLVDTVVDVFGGAYPELPAGRGVIVQAIRGEEERFDAVLTDGLPRLEEVLDRAASADKVVPGEAVFRLYDTYGVPRDFIEDMIEDRKLALDRDGFERAMDGQRRKARAGSKFGAVAPGEAPAWQTRPELASVPDAFRGYDATTLNTQIVELLDANRRPTERLGEGDEGFVALAETPFYLQSGGQVSDTGVLTASSGEASVTEVIKVTDRPRFHAVKVERGTLQHRDLVTATVTTEVRDATRRNHTATHLLHSALRQVLGPHVKQAGSLVAPDRLRFDFAHFSALTPEQLLEIERIVNEHVLRNTLVQTDVKNTQEAIAAGAMALFGEKYGDRVRVVSIPGFSVELCGGTHVTATGDIGLFAIVSESGVAAGVRRIEAITGLATLEAFQRDREELAQLASRLNARPAELAARIGALQDENKRLARELQQARMQAALGGGAAGPAEEAVEVAGVTLVAREVSGLDKDGLRALVDQHRSRIRSGVVILASPSDGKVTVVVGVTPDLTTRAPAGKIVKEIAPIVGGGGGGRPDFAEAGGRDPSKIADMLAASRTIIEKMLTS